MFVRKFEADTLEEALKSIKKELGPDAIILKTITNKGIKGAFKSKKIDMIINCEVESIDSFNKYSAAYFKFNNRTIF